MKKNTIYWLCWLSPGSFTANVYIQIVDRLPQAEDFQWPDNAYAVQAYQRTDLVDDAGIEYYGKEEAVGPLWYHPDSQIHSLVEVEARDNPADEILIANMRGNDWTHMIYTRWNNWPQPYKQETIRIAGHSQ